MAITSAICSSFKQELLQGKHSFESSGGHTFKLALFDSGASLGAATTDYSTSEEMPETTIDTAPLSSQGGLGGLAFRLMNRRPPTTFRQRKTTAPG